MMIMRKNIEAALAKMGIANEAELNNSIRNMKPVNLILVAAGYQNRKAG